MAFKILKKHKKQGQIKHFLMNYTFEKSVFTAILGLSCSITHGIIAFVFFDVKG